MFSMFKTHPHQCDEMPKSSLGSSTTCQPPPPLLLPSHLLWNETEPTPGDPFASSSEEVDKRFQPTSHLIIFMKFDGLDWSFWVLSGGRCFRGRLRFPALFHGNSSLERDLRLRCYFLPTSQQGSTCIWICPSIGQKLWAWGRAIGLNLLFPFLFMNLWVQPFRYYFNPK